MMKRNRLIKFLSLILSLIFLLSACGGEKEDMTTAKTEDTASGDPGEQTAPEEPVNGLFAEYYKGKTFDTYVSSALEEKIDYKFESGKAPKGGLPKTDYSIRFSGRIKTGKAGRYTFTTLADDGVRLLIDGREIINDAGPHTEKESSGGSELPENTFCDITLEYYNGDLGGCISLYWEGPDIKKQIIPAENLYLPEHTGRVDSESTENGLTFTGAIMREDAGGYTLVIERYKDGKLAETYAKPSNGKNVWKYQLKADTEELKMSAYNAYITSESGAKVSETVSRRIGEDYAILLNAKSGAGTVSDLLCGSCMEDVNHELYGGIWSQMIFGESFEEAAALDKSSGFTAAGGNWYVDGSAIAIDKTSNGPKLILGESDCAEGYIEAEVYFSGEGAGFITKVKDAKEGADSFCGYEIALFSGFVRVAKHRNNYVNIADTSCAVSADSWVKLRADFTENTLKVSVNGKEVYSYTDSDPLKAGALGFRAWNADAKYRNAVISTGERVTNVDPSALAKAGGVSAMWEGEIKNAEGRFAITTSFPLSGKQSQLLELISGDGSVSVNNMGLNRMGMCFRKDRDYNGYIYARSEAPVKVTVALESADGKTRYAETMFTVDGIFAKYPFTLVSNAGDDSGRFVIELTEKGVVELGYAFLEPGAWGLYKGLHVRADVGQMLENQGISVLRFGGCMANASDWKWKKMTGEPEFRGSYNGWWYGASSYGFGIIEFLELCEALGITAVPDFSSYESASDMADFISFACGTDTSDEWVALRHRMGHPEPFILEYMEIGNEDKVDLSFAARFNKIANAVWELNRDVILVVGDFEYKNEITDPDKVTGASSGITNLNGQKRILENAKAKGRPVYFDLHFWSETGKDPYSVMNVSLSFYNALKTLVPEAETALCVFELNANSHHFERALCNAFAISFAERHSDIIKIMCSANALQVQGQNDNGWDQGLVFMDGSDVWYQAPAYIDRILYDAHLPVLLDPETRDQIHTADFDITCTSSKEGNTVTVKVFNRTGAKKGVSIDIPDFAESGAKLKSVIYADELRSVNTKNKPENTKPSEATVTDNALESGKTLVTVEEYSVSIFTFTKN